MALYGLGCIQQTYIGHQGEQWRRQTQNEVMVLDVLHWHVAHHESYCLGKDHSSKNTVVTSSPVNARQLQCIT